MRIASFDVGINHLAYCVLEKHNDEDPKIKNMKLLSIFPENETHKCVCETKSKNLCGKNAKMHTKDTDNSTIIYYCGTHAPDDAKEIKRINTKLVSFDKLSIAINKLFDTIKLYRCDKIVIENQPSMASKKMQFVSHLIFHECATRFLNKENSMCKMVYYAPRDKWKVYDGPEILIENSRKSKTRARKTDTSPVAVAKTALRNKEYKSRKNAGIMMTEYFLKKFNEDGWSEYFNSENHDKKDDIADCYLQGLTVLLNKKK
jgi:hypothetical protein